MTQTRLKTFKISDHRFKTVCGAARFPERHLPPKDLVAQMFYEVHSEERYVKSMPQDRVYFCGDFQKIVIIIDTHSTRDTTTPGIYWKIQIFLRTKGVIRKNDTLKKDH